MVQAREDVNSHLMADLVRDLPLRLDRLADKARHLPNLDNGALYALRHICLAEDKKLFGFKISPESLQELSRTSEQYTLAHLEHGLKSLDFLKSVLE